MRDLTDRSALPEEQDPPAALRERVLAGAGRIEARRTRVLPVVVAAATVTVLAGGAFAATQLHGRGSQSTGSPVGTTGAADAQASPAVAPSDTPAAAAKCLLIRSMSEVKAKPRLLVLSEGKDVAARRSLRQLESYCRTVDLQEPKCNGTLTLLGLGSPRSAVPVDEAVRRLHYRCLRAR